MKQTEMFGYVPLNEVGDNPAVLSWSIMKWKAPIRSYHRMVFGNNLNVNHAIFVRKISDRFNY